MKVTELFEQQESVNTLDYTIIDYLKYEYPSLTDRFKKELEMEISSSLIEGWLLQNKGKSTPNSLDIGCATCRYPKKMKSYGFNAFGYDTNQSIINVFKEIVPKDINILNKDITKIEAQHEKFNVITCMMGTFNHFTATERKNALSWISKSLTKDGVFICSIWNSEYLNPKFLSLYDYSSRKKLRSNLISLEKVIEISKEYSLKINSCNYTCFFDDQQLERFEFGENNNKIMLLNKAFKQNSESSDSSQIAILCFSKI